MVLENANQALAFTLTSSGIGVVAGVWFCVGSVLTSSERVAELAGTYWDYHPAQVQAYIEQAAQYSVGAPLLLFAFVMQVCAALVAPDALVLLPSVLNVPFVLLLLVVFLCWAFSYAAYRALVLVKGSRTHKILSAELEKDVSSNVNPHEPSHVGDSLAAKGDGPVIFKLNPIPMSRFRRLSRLIEHGFFWANRIIIRWFYFALYAIVNTVFFGAVDYYVAKRQFITVATVVVPTLAVLIGFSALLYNRARAFTTGAEQRRSLYAAERGMQGALLFLLALGVSLVVGVLQFFRTPGSIEAGTIYDSETLLWFSLPMMLVLFSFASFFMAIRAISHRLFRWVSLRKLLRRVR